MLEQESENSMYARALALVREDDLMAGLDLLHKVMSQNYEEIKVIFEHDYTKNISLPETLDKEWVHKGDGSKEISGKLLRLVAAGGIPESFYEHEITAGDEGIIVDFIMQRRGGGQENCQLMIDTQAGSELVRFNQSSVHFSSNYTKSQIDCDAFHSFRLILENKICVLLIDGRLSLISHSSKPQMLNKIMFGCTKGLSTVDFESTWPLIRVGLGKNILNKMIKSESFDSFFSKATEFYNTGKISSSVRELSKLLLFRNDNKKGVQLLYDIIDKVNVRDPSVYLIDELTGLVNNPQISEYWQEKRSKLTSHKVIEVENVGVKFLTNVQSGTLAGLWDSFFSIRENKERHFWALRNISFSVLQGEIVGIIGLNGSGKSTLLRVIADILSPDEGKTKTTGKPILLAPGMAFREELTGRDNVYLGCLFMGMKRAEIDKHFDEIVAFAELWEHIDRTFKYYSDGMKSRLNFAVATQFTHDILLLDELLSAGDITFNRKAAKRMEELVLDSTTAVIVTHSTEFVREYCTKAIYLEKGHVKYLGDPERAVDMYILDGKN